METKIDVFDGNAKDSSVPSIKVFENPEFGEVRTVVIDDEIWFVGNDVAGALNYDYPKNAIRDNVDEEDKQTVQLADIQDCPKTGLPDHMKGSKIVVINKNGLVSLIQKSERVSRARKRFLIERFGLEDKFYAIERKEINFEDDLIEFFKGLGFEVKRQFGVGIYRVDFYIPGLQLVIEYDEDGHNSYDKKDEVNRELYIKESGFDIVRVDSRNSNVFNLGIITNHILNRNE